MSIAEVIQEWAIDCNVSLSTVDNLIVRLRSFHKDLPNARQLLHNKIPNQVSRMADGHFAYIGIKENLQRLPTPKKCQDLNLMFNVDGISLFTSSVRQMWAITCLCKEISQLPFLVAMYDGMEKPPLNPFLRDFVCEVKELKENGLILQQRQVDINTIKFVCDLPARKFITCTVQHNAYSSCDFCTIRGSYEKNRMTFCSDLNEPRTNAFFRSQCLIELGNF